MAPAPECILVVCRHGETHENVAGVIQGQSDGQLTQRGCAQAQLLAQRLSGQHFDRVFCSDLKRAVDTLRFVHDASACNFPEPTYTKLLRERSGGLLEGQPLSALQNAMLADGRVAFREWRPEGGESWEDVSQRAHAFLDHLLAELRTARGTSPTRVLAITHGGFIHELLAALGAHMNGRAGNTAVYELSLRVAKSGKCWSATLLHVNDTSHLASELTTASHGGRNA